MNLALALQGAYGNTALVDVATVGHTALHMNLKPLFSVSDALRNLHRLDHSLLEGFMTRHESGLHVLAGANVPSIVEPSTAEIAAPVRYAGGALPLHCGGCIHPRRCYRPAGQQPLANRVAGGPCGRGVAVERGAHCSNIWAETGGRDQLRLVLNRFRRTPGFTETDAETAAGVKLLWKIPNQYAAVSTAIDRGIPLMQQSHTEIARAFSGLATRLTENDAEVKRAAWSLFKTV